MGMKTATAANSAKSKKSHPSSTLLLWLSIALATMVCGYALSYGVSDADRLYPRAGIHVGKKLAWRRIAWFGFFPERYNSAVGQFEMNTDQELLLCFDNKPSEILDEVGKRKHTGLGIFNPMYGFSTWDYNADGVDDLVVQDMNQMGYPVSKVFVFDINGNKLATLFGNIWSRATPVVHLKPDKAPQLILANSSKNGTDIYFYKPMVTEIAPTTIHRSLGQLEALDLDHDGIDEIMALEQSQGKEDIWLDIDNSNIKRRYTLPKPTFNSNFVKINAVGDFGYFYKPDAYINLSTNVNVHLRYPSKMPKSNLSGQIPWYSITSGNFLGAGEPQIAIAYGASRPKSAILLFTASGDCQYYQELGCDINNVACLRAGGKDHLIVLARNKVLIYP
jgi:hypothetical protein